MGANLYNYRVKTGNSKGGQYKHQRYNLNKKDVEKLIEENKIEVREVTLIIKGNSKNKPLIKYRYELEIKPYIEKHVFKYENNAKEKLPKELKYNTQICISFTKRYKTQTKLSMNIIRLNISMDFENEIDKILKESLS